ncbi:BatA domain-containing protein, partial [Singulisphaera rosea]
PPTALESLFAVNPDPAESDPAKLDRATLADAIPGWKFAYLTNWKELSSDAGSVTRRGELHRSLLYGVLVLLLVESTLAWYFGHHANTA